MASGWEIATKVRLGEFPETKAHFRSCDRFVSDDGFAHLPVTHDHAIRSGSMEDAHGDPFDRIVAAQALILGLTVATRDRKIAGFGCEVIW